jgi:uncharacterized membrane protein
MSPIIAIHMSAAIGAIVTGPVALWARKGAKQRPRLHRAFGYAWVTLMLATAISAVFIRDHKLPNIEGFTPIHLLVPVVFFSLFGAFWMLARGNVGGHARIMQRLYVLACIVTGFFTLLPGRYLGDLLWGHVGDLSPILRNTPRYVWALVGVLVVMGIAQMRERTQGLLRVSVPPVVMAAFSLGAAVSAFGRSPLASEALWLWLLAAAAIAGLFAITESSARYDAATRTFRLPGSWVPLVLFLGVFLARYFVAVRLSMQPDLIMDSAFVLPVATMYGAFSGVFLGRAAQLWRLPLRSNTPALAA